MGRGDCCFFVFDWWGVSTAIQIRLYAGLLSLLPQESVGCHCMCTELLLKTADLPTKTTWEKGKGEPTTLSTTGGDMQLSREVRWATGRVAAPSVAYDGGSRLYPGGDPRRAGIRSGERAIRDGSDRLDSQPIV